MVTDAHSSTEGSAEAIRMRSGKFRIGTPIIVAFFTGNARAADRSAAVPGNPRRTFSEKH